MARSFKEWLTLRETFGPQSSQLYQQLLAKVKADPENQLHNIRGTQHQLALTPEKLASYGMDPQALLQSSVLVPHHQVGGFRINPDFHATGGKLGPQAGQPGGAPPPPAVPAMQKGPGGVPAWIKQAKARQAQQAPQQLAQVNAQIRAGRT